MSFNTLAKKRASIRKFSSKKPPIERITEAIEISNLAPSPGNLGIIRYLIVENSEKINKIAIACQQSFISQASSVVVICSEARQPEKLYGQKADRYIKQHAGAVIQNFLLKITDLKLASCWVGAYSEETLHSLLNIPDNITIEAVIPVGYQHPYDKTKQKTKSSTENRVYFESYKNKHKSPYRKVGDH